MRILMYRISRQYRLTHIIMIIIIIWTKTHTHTAHS